MLVELRRSLSGTSTAAGELVGAQAVKRAVWPILVVVVSPSIEQRARMAYVAEPLDIEKLIPQATVETLRVTVLPWASWCDVKCLDVEPRQPLPNCFRSELRTVVAADMFWRSKHSKQL